MSRMSSSVFRYTEAIVSRIPDSLSNTVGGGGGDGGGDGSKSKSGKINKENKDKMVKIDLSKCRAEFESLVTVLREIGLDVIELPPDESCPLSPFVGDVAFVINGMGVVTKPKSKTRQTEVIINCYKYYSYNILSILIYQYIHTQFYCFIQLSVSVQVIKYLITKKILY